MLSKCSCIHKFINARWPDHYMDAKVLSPVEPGRMVEMRLKILKINYISRMVEVKDAWMRIEVKDAWMIIEIRTLIKYPDFPDTYYIFFSYF